MYEKQPSKGSQGFQRVAGSQPSKDSVGRPLMTVSALKQASGEAHYLDDLPHFENELYAGLVLSGQAHATFTMDTSALKDIEVHNIIKIPLLLYFFFNQGVVDIVTAADVPGSNITGIGNDESVFADGTVTSVGQIIAIVLAKDKLIAMRAVKSVKVKYEVLPAVITIEVYIHV